MSDRFVFITDLHLSDGHTTGFHVLERAIARIKAMCPTPEFIIVGGDVTNVHGADCAWRRADSLIRDIGLPVYHVIGNHDCDYSQASNDAPSAGKLLYVDETGARTHAFGWRDYTVITLDTNFPGAHIDDEQLAWVEEQLQPCPTNSKVIFVVHASVYDSSRERHFPTCRERLESVLRDDLHYFEVSGHTHQNTDFQLGNWRNFTVSSLCGNWWKTQHGLNGAPLGFAVFVDEGGMLECYYQPVDSALARAFPRYGTAVRTPFRAKFMDMSTDNVAVDTMISSEPGMVTTTASCEDHTETMTVFVEPELERMPWTGADGIFGFTLFAPPKGAVTVSCNGEYVATLTSDDYVGERVDHPFAHPLTQPPSALTIPAAVLRDGFNQIEFDGDALILQPQLTINDQTHHDPLITWLQTYRDLSPVAKAPPVFDTAGTNAPHFCLLHRSRFFFDITDIRDDDL